MNQEDLRNRLLIEVDAVTRDAVTLADGLSAEELAWRAPGCWSVGQILEHLVATTDRYCGRIRGRIFSPTAAHVVAGSQVDWQPSLAGWAIVRRLHSPRPIATRSIYAPPATPRPDIIPVFRNRQATLIYLLRASAALFWNGVHAASPSSAFIRLNLGDAFSILVAHAQRHLGQMERARASLRAGHVRLAQAS